MATEQNIGLGDHYFTGESKQLPFVIYQSDESTPQNITGWSLSWMVKAAKTDEDEDALVTKTTDSGINFTGASSGAGLVEVSDDDIAEIAGGTVYYHELKRTDSGLETVLIYGKFQLSQAVHR